MLYNARRYNEAIEQLQWTVGHAAQVVIAHDRLGQALDASQRFDDAIREFEWARRLSARASAPSASLACTYAVSDRRGDADCTLQSLLTRSHVEYVAAPCIAELYVALGDHDRAFEWLEKGVEERSSMPVTIQTKSSLRSIAWRFALRPPRRARGALASGDARSVTQFTPRASRIVSFSATTRSRLHAL